VNRFVSVLLGIFVAFALATWTVGCGSDSKDSKKSPRPSKVNVVYTPTLQMGGPGYCDIYEPPAPTSSTSKSVTLKNRPAIIAIHGGAWRSGSKYQVSAVASEFAREGFVVVAPDYSLGPRVQWPAPLIDLQACTRFMRENADDLGIDPKKIGAWGLSAGGHLATMLALVDDPKVASTPTSTTPPSSGPPPAASAPLEEIVVTSGRVRCAVDASGPADLTIPRGMGPDEDGILRDFLGAPRAELSVSQLLDASTTNYARRDASVLILHGTSDSFVSIEHSEHLFLKLRDVRSDVDFIRVYGGGHDGSTFHASEAWAGTLQFFNTKLAGPTSSTTSSSSSSPSSSSSSSSSSSGGGQ